MVSEKMKVGVTFHSYITDMKKHNITVDEACRFVRQVDFAPSAIAFDAAFERGE